MSMWWIALTLAATTSLGWSLRAHAQALVPVGPQFQVNTYTTLQQTFAVVAADAAGNFVVVWASEGSAGSDTSGSSIQAQRYDGAGDPQGGQFQVNSYTTGSQNGPALAIDGGGNFVVVWHSPGGAGTDTSNVSIEGQRYDADGTPQGGQFQVNTYTTGNQESAAVAADSAGNFLVVWQSAGGAGSDTSSNSIHGQRFNSTGIPQGIEFQVNTYTTDRQDEPDVAADGAGNFVVVWTSEGGAGSDASQESIQAQRFDGAGTPRGGQFQVNTFTTAPQEQPAVAADGVGNFVVVWSSYGSAGSDASQQSIHAQRYDSAGTPLGDELQVNTYTSNTQQSPAVAAHGAGNFVVVWRSYGSAGSDNEDSSIQGRRYDGTGSPGGAEFQVNTYTTGFQQFAAVAADGAGNIVAVWDSGSSGSDTSDFSVQAQRFAVPTTSSTSSTTSTTLAPTELLPGRMAVVRRGTLAKFVAKPLGGDRFTLPATDPVAVGGSLRVFDLGTTAGDDSYALPAGARWKGLGKPAGSKGYRYSGAGTPGDPCQVVLKASVIKAVCRGTGMTLTPPFSGAIGVVLSIGPADRYCAQFGGRDVKNVDKLTKRKQAPAPGSCPP